MIHPEKWILNRESIQRIVNRANPITDTTCDGASLVVCGVWRGVHVRPLELELWKSSVLAFSVTNDAR